MIRKEIPSDCHLCVFCNLESPSLDSHTCEAYEEDLGYHVGYPEKPTWCKATHIKIFEEGEDTNAGTLPIDVNSSTLINNI